MDMELYLNKFSSVFNAYSTLEAFCVCFFEFMENEVGKFHFVCFQAIFR